MHIPSDMLAGSICPVSAAVAAAGVAVSVFVLGKSKKALPSASKFALVSAAVFGIQMLNYPIWNGISGHLIGGVFAAAVLGTPAAVLSLALVLLLQTLLFADGGILMLGANIVNMSLLGAGAGGLIREYLLNKSFGSAKATGIAAFCSVELAVFALAAELLASGKGSLSAFAALIGVHTVLAVLEGFATVLLVSSASERSGRPASNKSFFALGTIIFASLMLAPFASAFPDAFEWTMGNFSMLPDAPNFVNAPFADYTVSAISHELASALAAGCIGVAATAVLAYAVFSAFRLLGKSEAGA